MVLNIVLLLVSLYKVNYWIRVVLKCQFNNLLAVMHVITFLVVAAIETLYLIQGKNMIYYLLVLETLVQMFIAAMLW